MRRVEEERSEGLIGGGGLLEVAVQMPDVPQAQQAQPEQGGAAFLHGGEAQRPRGCILLGPRECATHGASELTEALRRCGGESDGEQLEQAGGQG